MSGKIIVATILDIDREDAYYKRLGEFKGKVCHFVEHDCSPWGANQIKAPVGYYFGTLYVGTDCHVFYAVNLRVEKTIEGVLSCGGRMSAVFGRLHTDQGALRGPR